MPRAIPTQGMALTSTPFASGSWLAAAWEASSSMPAEIDKRTIGQTALDGTGGGATDVVGADEERYEGEPGRGGSDEGGGTKDGGSESMDFPATRASA